MTACLCVWLEWASLVPLRKCLCLYDCLLVCVTGVSFTGGTEGVFMLVWVLACVCDWSELHWWHWGSVYACMSACLCVWLEWASLVPLRKCLCLYDCLLVCVTGVSFTGGTEGVFMLVWVLTCVCDWSELHWWHWRSIYACMSACLCVWLEWDSLVALKECLCLYECLLVCVTGVSFTGGTEGVFMLVWVLACVCDWSELHWWHWRSVYACMSACLCVWLEWASLVALRECLCLYECLFVCVTGGASLVHWVSVIYANEKRSQL